MPINPKKPRQERSGQAEKESSELRSEIAREEVSQLNVRVPRSLHKRLKIKAVQEDREVAELVAEALRAYLGE